MTTRVIAQNIFTGEFLNWDVPLIGLSVTHTLSGPGMITGTLAPENASLKALIQPWVVKLHLEIDKQIRQTGILLPSSAADETITIAAEGMSGYPSGIPYQSGLSQLNIDPLDVVRNIWAHVQSFPFGQLGVQVSDKTTPVRIGTEVDTDGIGVPYQLNWWDNKDCGSEINTLATDTPFDYEETSAWNSDKTDVITRIEFGYPRLGRRRLDLRFAQGENIRVVVPIEETADEYASDVTVIGAGEGADALRATASNPVGGRLRRVVQVVDQTLTTLESCQALAADELRRRQASLIAVNEITVDARHSNAPYGSFRCGDDIRVDAIIPWAGRVSLWHRVTAYTYNADAETIAISLRRSETFRYGRDDVSAEDTWIMDDPVLSIMDQTTIVG